ncbi:MAG: tetratricopeptide repeat protein [Syntrophomonas sp.]
MNEEQNSISINDLFSTAGELIRNHEVTIAIPKLLEAIELGPDNYKVRNLLGTCYLRLGEHKRAAACWEEVMEREPENKTARTSLKSYHSPGNQFWRKRYENALFEMEKKNFEIAKSLLHQLLEENDGQVKIYQLLGLCYLATNDKHNAELVWKKGLLLDKSNPQLLEYLASVKEKKVNVLINVNDKTNDGTDNKLMFMKNRLVWAVSGVLIFALAIQAGIYIKNSRTDVSQTTNGRSIASEKGEKRSVPVIATVNTENQKTATTSNRADGNNETGSGGTAYDIEKEGYYYWAGRQNYLDGDWKNAVNNFRVVVDMQTYSYLHREALYYLARCQYLGGNLTGAEQSYLDYLKNFPDSNYYDDSIYYLGCIYYQEKNKVKAAEMFGKLLKISSESGYLSTDIYHKVMD